MLLLKHLVVFFLISSISCGFNEFQYIKLKRLRCFINPEQVYKNFTCFSKPYNRNTTTVTMAVYFKKPVTFTYVIFILLKNLAEIL